MLRMTGGMLYCSYLTRLQTLHIISILMQITPEFRNVLETSFSRILAHLF